MSEPTLAEQEFERWHELRKDPLKRELADASFVEAWAKVAYLAEARLAAMGRDVNKLQHRIGRQRKANRELLVRYGQMEEALRGCVRSIELIEAAWLPSGDKFAPDSFPGEALAMARSVLESSADGRSREPETGDSNRVEE